MGNLSQATREIMWNISNGKVIYILCALSVSIFGYGVYQRILSWKKGKPDDERLSNPAYRLFFTIKELILQKSVRESRFPAIFHSFIFYSFIVLLITTSIIALDYDFGTSLFKGCVYIFFTVAAEIAGVLILVGVLMAAKRRYIDKPETLETGFADTLALLLLALIVVTGFVAEGVRISVAGDMWQMFSPVGRWTSSLFSNLSVQQGEALHKNVWWFHTILVFGWIAVIPYTKFFHLVLLPANIFFSKMKPAGELSRVDIEKMMESEDFDEENFNVGLDTVSDFTWKQRLDFDACVSCGRCEEVCPAFMAGQPLSPKRFIADLKNLVQKTDSSNWELANRPEIIGNAVEEISLWHCRTCMACTQVCPAFITHVDTFVDIRRNQVVMKGEIPPEAGRCLKTMQSTGNPFGAQTQRVDFIKTLDVKIVDPDESCEVLYWIGCLTTFDPEKNKIAEDIIKLLKKCNVDVGVLGGGEICCGEPARVIGDEHTFQTAVKSQIEELDKRNFKTLLTSCPHCFNTLKNEYPQFDGKYNVVHHSVFLSDMINSGKLKAIDKIKDTITYHDPCYLGRYQKIFDQPRKVIDAVGHKKVQEMENHREKSLCCGGGGGHLWMDYKEGERINSLRVKQAQEKGADIIATSCPFCIQMLTDGLKMTDLDEDIKVEDIASLLLKSL